MKLGSIAVITTCTIFNFLQLIEADSKYARLKLNCHGKPLVSTNLTIVENKCLALAPKDTDVVCFQLCVLAKMGVVEKDSINVDAIDRFVEELYPKPVQDEVKEAIRSCAPKYEQNEKHERLTCGKGKRFVTCFEDITEHICTVKGADGENKTSTGPKFSFKYTKEISVQQN